MAKKILALLIMIVAVFLSACDSFDPIDSAIEKVGSVSSVTLRSDGISKNEIACTDEQCKEILEYLPKLELHKISADDVPVFYGGGLEIQLNYSDNTNFIFTVVGENYYEFHHNGSSEFYQDLSDISSSLVNTIYTAYHNAMGQV